jgi:3-mercaptopyruvate sulfurtransferase SseA
MRKFFLTAVAGACAAAALLAGCKATDTAGNTSAASTASNPAPQGQQPPNPAEAATRITAADLKQKLDAGQAVVYDTRAKTAYDQEHIKGALSMPSGEVAERTGELPKDKLIVFYCT